MDNLEAIAIIENDVQVSFRKHIEAYSTLIKQNLIKDLDIEFIRTASHFIEMGLINQKGEIDWEAVAEYER